MAKLKKTIENNIFFKVDFDGVVKKKKDGGFNQTVRFFIIGSLPVLVKYKDGEKEQAIISTPLEVSEDPYLRLLQGKRFSEIKAVEVIASNKAGKKISYQIFINEIVKKAERAIEKIGRSGKFNGKPISEILIINVS